MNKIAQEALKILQTAGLGKDVIDLLKEKIGLLEEKITTLEEENTQLKAQNFDLLTKAESEKKSSSSRPGDIEQAYQDEFDEVEKQILQKILEFDASRFYDEDLIRGLSLTTLKIEAGLSKLSSKKLIVLSSMSHDAGNCYALTPSGKELMASL